MDLKEAKEAISHLEKFLNGQGVVAGRLLRGEFQSAATIAEQTPELRDVPKLGSGCGVYFLLRSNGHVAYIGKATRGNMHQEVWGKLGTPILSLDGPLHTYPKAHWRETELHQEVVAGALRVAAFWIDPPELASLAEVYLQTVCLTREGRLPPLNSRIG